MKEVKEKEQFKARKSSAATRSFLLRAKNITAMTRTKRQGRTSSAFRITAKSSPLIRVNGKVKVEGAMIVKRHRKAVPQMNIEGGIIEQEAWVDISNVA